MTDPIDLAKVRELLEKATPEEADDDCEFCDGCGEIEFQHRVSGDRMTAGCPACVQRQHERSAADLARLYLSQADEIKALKEENERLKKEADENRSGRYRQALYIIANSGDYTLLHPDEDAAAVAQCAYSAGATAGKRSLAEFAQQRLAEIDEMPDAPVPHGGDFLRANTAERRAQSAESALADARKRLEEIESTVRLTAKSDKTHCIMALDRIAAIAKGANK